MGENFFDDNYLPKTQTASQIHKNLQNPLTVYISLDETLFN